MSIGVKFEQCHRFQQFLRYVWQSSVRVHQSNNDGKRERNGPVVEKTALNAADIYRSAGWGGSEMWSRLADRLNVLFIVRSPEFPSKILRRP